MVLAAIKKYPSQITSAFKRFPTASAFTFLIFITLVIETDLFRRRTQYYFVVGNASIYF
ncbi:hypothetical protein [Fibrobacter sp.]|uniref:hypothetical protein n=1 Tax=Fibrobacter sp. TaxID=35828 RepID=UPI0025BB09CD|nr:hypothetical protein [Fibrobacter sp.]MBR3070923.1 hypothetical protein [Fibrobacter sp.]